MDDENDPCPVCSHPMRLHNDAGTFRRPGGGMRCYYNGSDQQFHGNGEPVTTCNCTYSGSGGRRYLLGE